VFVGALSAAWLSLVAIDQAATTWELPLWSYLVAVPVVAFLTYVTRGAVAPVGGTDDEAS